MLRKETHIGLSHRASCTIDSVQASTGQLKGLEHGVQFCLDPNSDVENVSR